MINRRHFLQLSALVTGQVVAGGSASVVWAGRGRAPASVSPARAFEYEEATISQLQAAMQSRRESAVSLARKYLDRIESLDQHGPRLKSVIELNPDALGIARDLDREWKARGPRGPLHGIPVLLKDNLATHDRMMTTAGSLALLGSIPGQDSWVVKKLRAAGAVILGKTNLSEWANFRSDHSSSGWSGRGGQTRNPYALDRNPSGSSSGSAVAVSANLCAVAIGTETDGSIVSPSSVCGIVGLKPTLGLVSRAGIIPIAHSQDTAGPMARCVTDAAILLGAITGYDEHDPVTSSSAGRVPTDYTASLVADGLRGARIGIVRKLFPAGGLTEKPLQAALDELKRCGATLVEVSEDLSKFGDAEMEVLLYEFKADLNAYLASLGPHATVHSLQEVIEFNQRHADRELPYFGQEIMLRAQAKGPLTEKAYLDALEKCRRLSRDEGIDKVMSQYQLDALVAPSGGPAGKTDLVHGNRDVGGSSSPAAVAGYPSLTVPAGHLFGLPFGLSFFGRAYSEPVLIKIAFAFEQATKARESPRFLPTIG
jgi:amidase